MDVRVSEDLVMRHPVALLVAVTGAGHGEDIRDNPTASWELNAHRGSPNLQQW
jgi:hypothetical protein